MGVMNKFMNFLGLQEEEEVIERERLGEPVADQNFHSGDPRRQRSNVVGIHSQKVAKMVLSEPRSYEETQEIADHLRSRRSVVVNLQRVHAEQAVRIVDFLSGTVYALNGSISKVGSNIFLCTPDTVEIQGSITDMLDSDGDYKRMR